MAKAAGGEASSFFIQPQLPGRELLTNTVVMRNRRGEQIGHIEVVQDIAATAQVSNYQAIEVERLARNLRELAAGNLTWIWRWRKVNAYTEKTREYFVTITTAFSQQWLLTLAEDAHRLSHAAVERGNWRFGPMPASIVGNTVPSSRGSTASSTASCSRSRKPQHPRCYGEPRLHPGYDRPVCRGIRIAQAKCATSWSATCGQR